MLVTIGELKQRVRDDLPDLISALQFETGRYGDEEAESWRSSLPMIAQMLSPPSFDALHVFFASSGHAALEYQLPAASSWCDMVLLGSSGKSPSALVLELKHWGTIGDAPGAAEGLMVHLGKSIHHPSRQVGGYTEYIRRFHSEVLERNARVNGCVVFTRSGDASSYVQAPNVSLTNQFPIFAMNRQDVHERFPKHVNDLLSEPDPVFAEAFERGKYKQDRGFVRQIGLQIQDPKSSPFVLLDNQDQAFVLCRHRARQLLDKRGSDQKRVIIVHGPPGSGKSVVAAQVWAALVTDDMVKEGNVVVTTTSASQNSNWVHLVAAAAMRSGAAGIVKKATGYHPISTATFGRLRKKHGAKLWDDALAWRKNIAEVRTLQGFQAGAEDNSYLVSLVDEAHALINPEHSSGRGQFGFAPTLGPQAYHIIRSSLLTVFFMDPDQGYRDRENTSVDDIRKWAGELGATVEDIDLSGAQFRCAGSKEYVDWVEGIRTNMHAQFAARNARRWKAADTHVLAEQGPAGAYALKGRMIFDLYRSPAEVEDFLAKQVKAGFSARLLASYWREWKTKGAEKPHQVPEHLRDFQIPYVARDGQERIWAKSWNYVANKGNDYSYFVQAAAGSAIKSDPLSEVGCPYVVRGFDFDFIGLLWGPDLVWREKGWMVDPEHVFETGLDRSLGRAEKEKDVAGPAHSELLKRVWQSYRILLTRALRGVAVYVADDETREYLRQATKI